MSVLVFCCLFRCKIYSKFIIFARMKRIIVSLFIAALSVIAAQAQIVKSYEKPAEKEFKAAVKQVLKNTTCMAKDTVDRLEALNIIQREINNFPAEDWKDFTNIQVPLLEYSIEVYVNDTIMGTAKVNYNTFCEGAQISATPNIGYHFVQWSDGNGTSCLDGKAWAQ